MNNPLQIAALANYALGQLNKTVAEDESSRKKQEELRMQNQMFIANSFRELIQAYLEYARNVDEEKTKRLKISAWETTTLARIKAQRELLMAYLDHSFHERERNFQALFDLADSAITSGNNQQLGAVLEQITELAKNSPLKDLINIHSVQAALSDPSHEWKF